MTETITWVSVAERLPVQFETVLVSMPGWPMPAYRSGCEWLSIADRRTIHGVTHWAEMPKGPSNV